MWFKFKCVAFSTFLAASFLWIFSITINRAEAQYLTNDQLQNMINGVQTTGCTQVAVTTTGHNRSGPLTAGKRYKVYGYNGADISAGDAIKCVWGTSSVDVTGLGGALVGETIYAGQQRIFLANGTALYISCISKTASMKYDICPVQ